MEACWAHNPEVRRSKLRSANFLIVTPVFGPDLLQGSVAERSKALVLGTSLFGGVGSNPTAATGFGV